MQTIAIPLVGTHFRGSYAVARVQSLAIDEELSLVPEPSNQFDPEAIQVHTLDDECFIGFVANKGWEEEKAQVWHHIDNGGTTRTTFQGVEEVGNKQQYVLQIELIEEEDD